MDSQHTRRQGKHRVDHVSAPAQRDHLPRAPGRSIHRRRINFVAAGFAAGVRGFGMKWNLGWMHDTLDYFKKNPLYRKYHQHELTFSLWYAFYENFVLPLSHDEIVHGKG